MVKTYYCKATDQELAVDFSQAVVNWLEEQPNRFTPHAKTIPEMEQMDCILNNSLYEKIRFINHYKNRRNYRYVVMHTNEHEEFVLKETVNGWLVFDWK